MRISKPILAVSGVLLGVLVVGTLVACLVTNATKRVAEGDAWLYAGKPTQALSSYGDARNLWPFLYADTKLTQKIQLAKDAEENIKNSPALVIFFRDTATEVEIHSLEQQIKKTAGVDKVDYISKEAAFKRYSELNKADPELMRFVTPDILPASLEVYIDDPEVKEFVSKLAEESELVEEVVKNPTK